MEIINVLQDRIKRSAEKQNEKSEFSPMEPPDAYKPPVMNPVPYELFSPILRELIDEHKIISNELDKFEQTLLQIRKEGYDKETNKQLTHFFEFLDDKIVHHHLKEDRYLFPLLHQRLLETGEHSTAEIPETAVDMMENDHIKTMQLAALIFNIIGISARIPDAASRTMLIDFAIEHGMALVEAMRLHIFREDNVVFALAHKHINADEFKEIEKKLMQNFPTKKALDVVR